MGSGAKRLVFLCELGMLLAAAFLSARLINGRLAERLAVAPQWPGPVANEERSSASPSLSLAALERLFPQALARPETSPVAASPLVDFRRRLVGTLVANRREWSMASVKDERTGTAAVVMEGDLLDGRRVVSIERWRVLLESGEVLALAANDPAADQRRPPATPATQPSGIRQLAADSFSIEREWLEKTLADPNAIVTGIRVLPAFEDGRAVGFKLSMRPGSILGALGLQSGDVLRRINGLELNSPERALEAFAALRTANRLELELTRAGRPVRQRYDVAP